jgi:hypothetical protein
MYGALKVIAENKIPVISGSVAIRGILVFYHRLPQFMFQLTETWKSVEKLGEMIYCQE